MELPELSTLKLRRMETLSSRNWHRVVIGSVLATTLSIGATGCGEDEKAADAGLSREQLLEQEAERLQAGEDQMMGRSNGK